MKNKFNFDALFDDKRFTVAISLLLAVLTWLAVITVVDPNRTDAYPVPIDFEYNATAYTSQGLDIVVKPNKTIKVGVSGDGSVLGGLSANDILVYPDYSAVKGPGTYTLKLKITPKDSTKKYTITGPVDQVVEVTFDKVVSKKFAVTVLASGIQTPDGYYMDQAVPAPTEVTLTGPEVDMNRVEKVVANIVMNEERTESAIASAKLQYLDINGKPIEGTYITADVDQVEVTIPILKEKELPLVLEYTGVPAGYDPAQLGAKLSETKIRVAGPADQLDALESITAGYIDLAKFKLGETVTCAIELPDGLRNVDNLQEVTVSFETIGYSTKMVYVTQLSTVNVPTGVRITFPNERINGVVLIGDQKELEALDAANVVAQIDASAGNISVSNGQQNMPVKILVPSTKTVFAVGSYTVLCDIETTAAASSSTAQKGS